MLRVPPAVSELVASCKWEVMFSFRFSQSAHINLQEIRALKALMVRVLHSAGPGVRFVVCVDSQVTLGAVCKGRSSSFQVNGLLRMLLGLQVFGRCRVLLLWVPSECNPADYPSRFVEIPDQLSGGNPIITRFVKERLDALGPSAPFPPPRAPRPGVRFRCLEVFSGSGNLTRALRAAGFLVETPLEAFPKGVYFASGDILNQSTLERVRAQILAGDIDFVHFGLPCKSWGPLARMNGCSRTRLRPQGALVSKKERLANHEARVVGSLCALLSKVGAFWSVENPRGSYCFAYFPLRKLLRLPGVFDVHFDQCMFHLQLPGAPPGFRVKKATTIRTNVAGFRNLESKCDGNHQHSVMLGSMKLGNQRVPRSGLCGVYPGALCRALAANL